MNLMLKLATPLVGSVVRHAASGLGAVLVAHGLATNDQATQIAGGLTAAAAVAWSWWQKRQQAKAVQTALMAPPPQIIDPVKAGLM